MRRAVEFPPFLNESKGKQALWIELCSFKIYILKPFKEVIKVKWNHKDGALTW